MWHAVTSKPMANFPTESSQKQIQEVKQWQQIRFIFSPLAISLLKFIFPLFFMCFHVFSPSRKKAEHDFKQKNSLRRMG